MRQPERVDVTRFQHRLGAKPPLRPYSAIKIKLRDYLKLSQLSLPAANYGYAQGIRDDQFPMFLNDEKPDCTWATVGHMDLVHEFRTEKVLSPVSDEAIWEGFHNTGLEQGLSDFDGRYHELVWGYMARKGLRQPDGTYQKILGYAVVDPSNLTEVKAAGRLFGGVAVSVGLPERALYQLNAGLRWSLAPGPGSLGIGTWGYHAMYVPAFNSYGFGGVTWADRQAWTVAWHKQFCVEMFAILTEDWINKVTGKSVSGVALEALVNDLGELNR